MAKPPPSPPSSDIDGVDEDRHRVDRPENSTAETERRREQEPEEVKGYPPGGRRA